MKGVGIAVSLSILAGSLLANDCKIDDGKWFKKFDTSIDGKIVNEGNMIEISVRDKVAFNTKKDKSGPIYYIDCREQQERLLSIEERHLKNNKNNYYNFATLFETKKNYFQGTWHDSRGKSGDLALWKENKKPLQIKNISYSKLTRQSSTGYGGDSSRAVDGNNNGSWDNNSVTHTNNDLHAWWEVDLGKRTYIDHLKIYNRTDCCLERLDNFNIIVSDKEFPPIALSQDQIDENINVSVGKAGKIIESTIENYGRYIRIQLKGQNYLSLGEVEVMGN
jgi:hypothetical protein